MPGVLSGGVLGKNSTPKILAHYDIIKMWHAMVEIPTLAFLAHFAYLQNHLSQNDEICIYLCGSVNFLGPLNT